MGSDSLPFETVEMNGGRREEDVASPRERKHHRGREGAFNAGFLICTQKPLGLGRLKQKSPARFTSLSRKVDV